MNARFYFANLIVDAVRCLKALQTGDETRYEQSLARARKTLSYLRAAGRPEAYEEGLLLIRGLALSRGDGSIDAFRAQLERLALTFTPIL